MAIPLHQSSVPTFAAYADHWLTSIRGTVRPHTREHYRGIVVRYWCPLLGGYRVDAITRRMVRDAMTSLLDRPLAPQTVAVAHSIVRMILQLAVDEDLVPTNVATGLARRLHRPVRPRQTLDVRQLNLFLSTAAKVAPYQYPLFVALAAGGLRVGEAIGLRSEDIDMEKPVISVRRTIRSGGKSGDPKTTKSRRKVRLTEPAINLLREVRVGESGWLFPGRSMQKPISYSNVATLVTRIAMRAGLPNDITPKTFRRSAAAVWRSHGASTEWAAAQLGHSSVKVTEGFYLDGAPPPPLAVSLG